MMIRPMPYSVALPEPQRTRHLAASVARKASLMLGRLARRLRHAERPRRGEPMLEFYAEAGAPEGALYLDGRLVGRLEGVSRL